ncbi:MAG: hypothetical protein ACAI25_20955 [Planctomycetota bacterium]
MNRLALAVTLLLSGGCVSESDVRKPVQDQLLLTGRIMGFALDARMEALETRLAVVEADPKFEAKLGKPEEIRKKIERVRADQLALQAELKVLRERYALEGEAH